MTQLASSTEVGVRHRWQVLAVTAVAVFMSFLDVTIVNIAFPNLRADFATTPLPVLSWVINGYGVVFAAALIPAGRLADRIGRRRLFLAGIVVFLLASALCGLAPNPAVLIAARVLQALGAAAVVPTSLALLLPEFPLAQRATATAIWGATGAVAAATGPALGGVLVGWVDWRLVFFVNVPIGIAALVPARRLLTESRDPQGSPAPDWWGAGLLALGVAALALAIVQVPARVGAIPGSPRPSPPRPCCWACSCGDAHTIRRRSSSSGCSGCAPSRWRTWARSCSRSGSTRCCCATCCS